MVVDKLASRDSTQNEVVETTQHTRTVDIVHIYDRVFISPNWSKNSAQRNRNAPDSRFAWVSVDFRVESLEPSSLAHIYSFHKAIEAMLADKIDKNLVIMIGSEPAHVTAVALLLGGHMIIGRGMSADDVAERLRPISYMFSSFADGNTHLSVEDCWRAIHRASTLGWTTFDSSQQDDGQEAIDMDEYLHYDDTPNGAMHLVDPARLLLFREPADLPAGVAFEDEGGRRRFGAEHYAGLFEDFGVRLVVRCGGGAWDCEALRAAGMAVEDLRVTAGGAGMLSAVDRFLTLARVAPGCIAVQCGGGGGDERIESEGGDDGDDSMEADAGARLVVAAHLIRNRGFGAGAAVAWTHIAHPAAGRPSPELVILGDDTSSSMM